MILNSQDLKAIFNQSNNNKEYEVFVVAAFNEYLISDVMKDGNKIYIVTKDIGGELVNKDKEKLESNKKEVEANIEIDDGPLIA